MPDCPAHGAECPEQDAQNLDDECYCDFESREFFGCFSREHDPICLRARNVSPTPN
jgi:hypothetical protein